MKSKISAAVIAAAIAASPVAAGGAMAQEDAALKAEAKQLIGEFFGNLKGELVAGMKAGGPVNAIDVCNTKAPGIADAVSTKSGWSVARSSHKVRNPNNAPDAFEMRAIDELMAQQAKGVKAADMAPIAMTVIEDGQKYFRFVKAIPTGEVCLNCHGADLKPAVKAKLDELYPHDKATGFSMGEMRGIFTLKKPL